MNFRNTAPKDILSVHSSINFRFYLWVRFTYWKTIHLDQLRSALNRIFFNELNFNIMLSCFYQWSLQNKTILFQLLYLQNNCCQKHSPTNHLLFLHMVSCKDFQNSVLGSPLSAFGYFTVLFCQLSTILTKLPSLHWLLGSLPSGLKKNIYFIDYTISIVPIFPPLPPSTKHQPSRQWSPL